jgi:hypothetical protein
MVGHPVLEEPPSQPQFANSIPDRQLRPRNHRGSKVHQPSPKSSKVPSGSSRRSSTMSNLTGPHRRPSRSEPLHLPADKVRMASLNRPITPLRTKTGRISKALKGLKVHECSKCRKVFHFQNGSSSSSLILTIDRCTAELSISGSPAYASTASCSQLDLGFANSFQEASIQPRTPAAVV